MDRTTERVLTEIIVTASNAQLRVIQQKYQGKYDRSLLDHINSEVSGVCLDDAHGLLELAELAIRLVELCVDILHCLSRLLEPIPDREEPRSSGRGFALRTRCGVGRTARTP